MNKKFAKLFGGVGTNIAEKISNIIDKHTFSKVEKAQFEKDMEQIFIKAELELEKEITSRHKNDMISDSWLSKNIRPLLTIFSLVLYTIFSITDEI